LSLSAAAASPTVVQDASAGISASFTVTLNPPSVDQAVTVDSHTVNGTALDYLPMNGTLTFPAGETTETIQVPTLDLSNPVNDSLRNGEARAALMPLNDPSTGDFGGADTASVTPPSSMGHASGTTTTTPTLAALPPGLTINDVSVTPTSAVRRFKATLGPPDPEDTITVDYHTVDNTARAYIDDSPERGILVFAPGQTSQEIDVPVSGTTAFHPDQSFFVDLSDPTHASLVDGQGTATVHDGNVPGVLQFGAAAYGVRGDAGEAVITVNRTGGNASDVGIRYSTDGGNAVAGTDYTPASGTLTFGAGEMSKTFTIPILPNPLLGGDRTVILTLGDPTGGGTLGPQGMAILSIHDTDSPIVTSTNDSGAGSLRRAIETANANPGQDAIVSDIPGTEASNKHVLGNTIGGMAAGGRNVIPGNGSEGLQRHGRGASANLILGNRIGKDKNPSPRLGNAHGLFVNDAPGNLIVGPGAGANVVTRNRRGGVVQDASLKGPSVSRVSRTLTGAQVVAIVLNFSDGLDPRRAADPGNYRLQTIGPDGVRVEATVSLSSASYDPVSRTVTLVLVHPIACDAVMQLTVNGKPDGGITDTTGNYLAGRAGGDFTTILGRAKAPRQGDRGRRA
jgi:hypothetical protein